MNSKVSYIRTNSVISEFRKLPMQQCTIYSDFFRNETEQNFSAAISSFVNKAYKTLLTPIKRAEYMLELRGITIPEDNSTLDKEFLLEIMERNEEVTELINLKN